MVIRTKRHLRRIAIWLALDLLFAGSLLIFSAFADTSHSLHQPKAAGCYCRCAQSKTSAGCAKMCELPKYASRWWAISCAKPRAGAPTETPEAGPRLPHADRPERASN